jgi:hypothetical protein
MNSHTISIICMVTDKKINDYIPHYWNEGELMAPQKETKIGARQDNK